MNAYEQLGHRFDGPWDGCDCAWCTQWREYWCVTRSLEEIVPPDKRTR